MRFPLKTNSLNQMKTKIKAKGLLSARLEVLADKVDKEIRKMKKSDNYPKYPAEMLRLMKKLYYGIGKAAFIADRTEEEKGWVVDENDQLKWSETSKTDALSP